LALEKAARSKDLSRFEVLDALQGVLGNVLECDGELASELGKPWGTFIDDDLHVAKLDKENEGIESDRDLADGLWPPPCDFEDNTDYLIALARSRVLLARLLRAGRRQRGSVPEDC
jgi:hypothetical protein